MTDKSNFITHLQQPHKYPYASSSTSENISTYAPDNHDHRPESRPLAFHAAQNPLSSYIDEMGYDYCDWDPQSKPRMSQQHGAQ
jgi:hypothetical protein